MTEPYEDRVLNAIADSLEGIVDLQESAYVLPNPTGPTAELMPGPIAFDGAMQRGLDTIEATLRVTVGTAMHKNAQKRLRRFRAPSGAESIKEAVEADTRLGGLVEDVCVTRVSDMRVFRRPSGSDVLGCDFTVVIQSSGEQD